VAITQMYQSAPGNWSRTPSDPSNSLGTNGLWYS